MPFAATHALRARALDHLTAVIIVSRPNDLLAADAFVAPIIVHSHLRWDFVWQRPQQLLSRLSARVPVLFVEEPIHVDDLLAARLDITRPCDGVFRAVPFLPAALRDKYDESVAQVRELIRRHACEDGVLGGLFKRPIQWFYTPMPAPAMIGAFGERAIVYDCMDELVKFRFAPPELTDRENLLLSEADVVFTGGYKLWESKSRHHANVHFFGCGVDVEHFGAARTEELPLPTDIACLAKPVVGYYGVIDERIDYGLLADMAALMPDVAIAMVGPVVKVAPEELPQAPNIHWLGQKQYAELPAYVKGFDVCLMPFALNASTEYINPTKTLEYMAAGKPIVSTAVADVVRHFTPVVKVGYTTAGFAALVRAALTTPSAWLLKEGLGQARDNSWESTVSRMEAIVAASLKTRDSERRVRRPVLAPAATNQPASRVSLSASPESMG